MSPDGIGPEFPLCWARTLVDDARPFVINSRAMPVTYAPLLQDRIDLTLNPLVSLNRAVTFGAFRIRSGIGKGPLWLFANLDSAAPRACHGRNEGRWISHLDRLGMVIEAPEGGWLRRLGVAGRGAAQQANASVVAGARIGMNGGRREDHA